MSGIALALENYPDADQNDWFEIIEGVKTMAASVRFLHNVIGLNLIVELNNHATDRKSAAIYSVDVHLPDSARTAKFMARPSSASRFFHRRPQKMISESR